MKVLCADGSTESVSNERDSQLAFQNCEGKGGTMEDAIDDCKPSSCYTNPSTGAVMCTKDCLGATSTDFSTTGGEDITSVNPNPYASAITGQDYGNPTGYTAGAAGYTSEDLIMGTSIFGGVGDTIKGTTSGGGGGGGLPDWGAAQRAEIFGTQFGGDFGLQSNTGGGTGGGTSGGGYGGGFTNPFVPPAAPADIELVRPVDGWGTLTFDDGRTMTIYNPQETLQQFPAYTGQSGSNPATYPAVGTTTPITPSGAGEWITDYNSVGFMEADTIRGGSYSAPSGGLFSDTQGTNPSSQVGISYPLQQDVYDTYSNVTGAGNQVYMGGSPSFNEATGQYTNVTSNPIANPNTLPTMLSEYDLFGNVGASSGLFLDTPTIKQNGVAGTSEVDAEVTAEPAQGGGLGLVTIGLIALKALSVI